jgi:hypothetical protein
MLVPFEEACPERGVLGDEFAFAAEEGSGLLGFVGCEFWDEPESAGADFDESFGVEGRHGAPIS